MGIAWTVGLSLISGALAIGFLRGFRQSLDDQRRQQECAAWKERKQRKRDSDIQALAERYFPFLEKSAIARALKSTNDVVRGLRSALRSIPGVVLGEGPWGLPIALPFAMRTRHGTVFGKTGSGKSTLGGHIVDSDLASGRNLVVISGERSAFRDDLLPRIPRDRASEVVYLTADPDCPVSLAFLQPEDGESADECAAEIYHAFRQATAESTIGGRSDAIARNTFRALATYPGATFDTIRPFLTDRTFRAKVLAKTTDARCKEFWQLFERFPKGAELPFLARIDQIVGSSARSILCRPRSSFSVSRTLDRGILLVDLSALDPDSFRLTAQLFLARVQLALMKRDRLAEGSRPFVSIVLDEFHLLAGEGSEYTFRQLLSRSRRMNAGLLLLTQHPGQLPLTVRDEILGNCSTVISFAVGAKDAHAIAREFTVLDPETGKLRSLSPEALVALPIGSGYARIGTGALALRVKFNPPIAPRLVEDGEEIKRISWQTFGHGDDGFPAAPDDRSSEEDSPAQVAGESDPLTDLERRFLAAVVDAPALPSGHYGRLLGLNGTRGARIRKSLIAKGYLREHRLARRPQGKPAVILEPTDSACSLVAPLQDSKP